MTQDARIVVIDGPARHRHPVEDGLEPYLVRGALDQLRPIVGQRRQLEARKRRQEVADDMRRMDARVALHHTRDEMSEMSRAVTC